MDAEIIDTNVKAHKKGGVACLLKFLCLFLTILVVYLALKGYMEVNETTNTTSETATSSSPATPEFEESVTNATKKLIYLIKHSIDPSVQPCDDFFKYVCGNFVKNTKTDSASLFNLMKLNTIKHLQVLLRTSEPSDAKTFNTLRVLYKKCIYAENDADFNGGAGKYILSIIKGYGHFPMIHKQWNDDNFDVTTLLAYFNQNRTVLKSFMPFIVSDIQNISRSLFMFAPQPDKVFGKAFGKGRGGYSRRMMDIVVKLFREMAHNLWQDDGNLPMNMGDTENDILNHDSYAIAKLEERMNNVTSLFYDNQYGYDSFDTDRLFRLSELDRETKSIKWTKLFSLIAPDEAKQYVMSDPVVAVTNITFLKMIDQVLSETPTRVLTNYVIMRFVISWAEALDGRYRRAINDFYRELSGDLRKSRRDVYCFEMAKNQLYVAMNAMYQRSRRADLIQQPLENMLDNILSVVSKSVSENTRMDNQTKQAILKKVHYLIKKITWNEEFTSKYLDEYYEEINSKNSLPFLELLNVCDRFGQKEDFQVLMKEWSRDTLSWDTLDVNAYYAADLNRLVIPLPFVQYPVFELGYPRPYSYGSIGMIMAHELFHGFDSGGKNHNYEGKFEPWLSYEEEQKFNESANCVINVFNKTKDSATDEYLDGERTLPDNLADFEGVKYALEAYKLSKKDEYLPMEGLEEFTDIQLFFIGVALKHCSKEPLSQMEYEIATSDHAPHSYRVNYAVANRPDFAAAFRCKPGSRMNPNNRCTLWF